MQLTHLHMPVVHASNGRPVFCAIPDRHGRVDDSVKALDYYSAHDDVTCVQDDVCASVQVKYMHVVYACQILQNGNVFAVTGMLCVHLHW